MSEKRKKVVLAIQDKLQLIKKMENGSSKKQMCLQYGIGETTVRDILKQKDKLLQFASTSDSSNSLKKRKTMKASTYEELDAALLKWVFQVRSEGTPVSGPIVAAKAKQFFEMLGLQGPFDASSGWLARFKQRYGISKIGLHGEKSRNDPDVNLSDSANKEDMHTVCSHSDDCLKQQQEATSSNPTDDSSAGPSNVKPPYVLKESKMLVNVAFLVKSLQNLNNHGGDGCNFSDMYISGETNNDWNVGIELSCSMCLTTAVVWMQDPGPDLKKQRPPKPPTSAGVTKKKTPVTSETVLSTPAELLKKQEKTNSKEVPANERRFSKRKTTAAPPDPPVQQHFMLPPPLAGPLQVPQSNFFHQEWPGNPSYLMNPHSSVPQPSLFPRSSSHSINPYIMVPQSNSIHQNLTDSPMSSINSHFINRVPFFKQEIGAPEYIANPFLNRVPLSSTQPVSVQLLFSVENSNDMPLSLDENVTSTPGATFRNHQTSPVIGLKTSQNMATSANETIVPEVKPNAILPVDLNLVKAEIEEESHSMEVNNMPCVRIVPMSETSINRSETAFASESFS